MLTTIQQRRDEIMAQVYQKEHVSVKQLAEALKVSEATIRRDLHGMASEGLLELSHGGAALVRNSDYSFLSKSIRNIEAKQKIAKLASDMVDDGDQIFLDSGTTCYSMAAFLRTKKDLTVIVNSVRTAQELQVPGIHVLMLGGQYRPERMDTVGPMACGAIERLRGYRAFLGTDGLSLEFGLTSIDIDSAHLFGLVARNARESILLADSSKFDKPALYKILDLPSISAAITDQPLTPKWDQYMKSQSISVLYPEEDQEKSEIIA